MHQHDGVAGSLQEQLCNLNLINVSTSDKAMPPFPWIFVVYAQKHTGKIKYGSELVLIKHIWHFTSLLRRVTIIYSHLSTLICTSLYLNQAELQRVLILYYG